MKTVSDRAEKFASQARHYLANATKLSREPMGIEKAGEMVWGAFILAIKAIAAKRGDKVTRYKEALRYAREIAPDEHFMTTLAAAKGLHGQFYEAEADRDLFLEIKDKVEVAVDDVLTREGL